MSRDQDTGKQTGVVSWSSLDEAAADIAARWNTLLNMLSHYRTDEPPAGTITNWRDLAACKHTYHPCFFPEDGRKATPGKRSLKQAQGWCDQCVVTDECLSYAIRNDIRSGVWGGKTYHQRHPKRKL